MKIIVTVLVVVFSINAMAQIPTNGLVRQYTFSGNANDNVNSQHGTIIGSTLTSDRFGNPNSAFYFDGVNDYIDLPLSGLLLNEYTYSLWVSASSLPSSPSVSLFIFTIGTTRPGNSQGGDQAIIANNSSINNGWGLMGYYTGSNSAFFTFHGTTIVPLTWYHITVTRSANVQKLYIDCQLVSVDSSATPVTPFYGNTPTAKIGTRQTNYNFFHGKIDDVRIYNRALSANEILPLCNEGSPCNLSSNFSATNTCLGDSTFFTDLSVDSIGNIVNWQWYFGDGDSLIGIQNPSHLYNGAGNYNVTLIITNNINCVDSITIPIIVNPSYSPTQSASICQGDSIFLAGNFQNSSGQYTDSLSTTFGCDSLIITNLVVNPTFNDSSTISICQGDSVFLNGSFQHNSGVFTDSLQSITGCDSVVTTNLIVNPVFSSIQNSTICQGDSILFGSNFYGFSGTFSDSLQTVSGCDSVLTLNLTVNASFQNIQTVSICSSDSIFLAGNFQNSSGQYTDSLSTTFGCDSLIITNLVVNPTFNDSSTISICQGDSVFFNGSFQHNSGIFTDSLQSITGCDSVVTTNLIVSPSLSIIASNDTIIEACGSVQLNVNGGVSYLWSPSIGLSCTSCPNPIASPIITTSYVVSSTTNGCSDNDTVIVVVEGSSPLIIPNVFTPNQDGVNDGFNFSGGCLNAVNKKIYNRWGQLLFESNQIAEEWNGRMTSGEEAPEGTYFYIFTISLIEDGNEITKIFKGTVTLLR